MTNTEKPRDYYLSQQMKLMKEHRSRIQKEHEQERSRSLNPATIIVGTTGPLDGGAVTVNQP